MKSRAWKAFLPIPSSIKSDQAPSADAVWLMTKGIEPEALSLLRVVRNEVADVIAACSHTLDGFHFLVHTHAEGVPCPPDDSRAFIDLSLYFKKPISIGIDNNRGLDALRGHFLSFSWLWIKPREGEQLITPEIELLNKQSALYLELVKYSERLPPLEALMQIRQSLHYFANMSQCRIA